MKKISFLLIAILCLMAGSCKKNTVDVTDLLKSVPSSAAGVVVFNLADMFEKTGCKVKDHQVTLGREMEEILNKTSRTTQEDFKMLFDGSTGIEPDGAVLFYDSNRAFLTFALSDENKFMNFIESKRGVSFSEESGVKICENVAVKGTQAWICVNRRKNIDADAISAYAGLSTSQSFLVTPMGEELLVSEKDIRGWALLQTFTNEFIDRRDSNMLNLGLGFVFEGAKALKFSAEFEKGEFEATAIPLNDKGKPAKYQFPADKVDVESLKSIGGTCDGMMAFTINSKLVKKLNDVSKAFGGLFLGDLEATMKNVNGTVGIVASGINTETACNGFITTKGDVSRDLKSFISEHVGSVTEDGKLLRFSKGNVSGNLSVAECAEELKGCCMGIVVDNTEVNSIGAINTAGFKSYVIKLEPESGSLEIEVKAYCANEKENSLLTLLRSY